MPRHKPRLDRRLVAMPVLPAIGLPAIGLPAIGLPAIGLPAIGLPAIGLPAIGLPAIGLPAVMLLAVMLGGCKEQNKFAPPPPPQVGVARPVQQPVQAYLEGTGNTVAG